MGQHKYNPNCELAKNGQLPLKPKRMGKREWERIVAQEIAQRTGLDQIYQHIEKIY